MDIKVNIPMHVLYSESNLGAQFNSVSAVWSNFTHPSAGLTVEAIDGGHGHFIVEEAPVETVGQLMDFMDRLGVANGTAPVYKRK